MTVSNQILAGLVSGVAVGLFFGEKVAGLSLLGDAYVGLLQMTVLPYVVVSLMGGLGSLSFEQARALALRGGGLLLLLWGVAFATVALMPLAFPVIDSASFFSTTLIERPPSIDVLSLYVPSNPFESLANSDVPAVVLFSIAVGVALMGVDGKEPLLRGLAILSEAMMRVTRWLVRITPFGVFAIGASAAGTMTVEEFGKVQVYLVSYIAFALLLTFWVLPGLVATLTKVPHRKVASAARDALVTAFATGSDFVVLPLLAERSKTILAEHYGGEEGDEGDGAVVDVVIPISHNFPHTAKILSLSFITFAAWFTGTRLELGELTMLGAAGVASTFGSVNMAIPFLLDLFHLPSDLFQLFVATSVVNARFGTLLATMHGFCLVLLVACALAGRLRFDGLRCVRFVASTVALVALTSMGVGAVLTGLVDTTYDRAAVFAEFRLARAELGDIKVYDSPASVPPRAATSSSRAAAIVAGSELRACYFSDGSLPFTYTGPDGSLMGFDVEMAYSLARGLGTGVAFVTIERSLSSDEIAKALRVGTCDLVLGMVVSMDRSRTIDYSRPYLDLTMAFLVPDHRRGEFADRADIEQMTDLRLAVPGSEYYLRRVRTLLPDAGLVTFESLDQVLGDSGTDFDAILHVAEIASAYSLLYPDWSVVVPDPPLQRVPMAFGMPEGDSGWINYVDSWLALKQRDDTIEHLYAHWVLGRGASPKGPRWSIARDLLGWID